MMAAFEDDEISRRFREGDTTLSGRSATRRRRIRTMDFSSPAKLDRDQQRKVRSVHEGWCRRLAVRISATLRVLPDIEVVAIQQSSWKQMLSLVPEDSTFGVIQVTNTGRPIYLAVQTGLLLGLINRQLGGTFTGSESITRSRSHLTDIELALALGTFEKFVAELDEAWSHAGQRLELSGLEHNRWRIQPVAPTDAAFAITVEIVLDGRSWAMTVLCPYSSLGAIDSGSAYRSLTDADGDAARHLAREAVAAVDVEVRVRIGSREIPVDALLGLAPGDVVVFEQRAEDAMEMLVADVPVCRAMPGNDGIHRAIQVINPIDGAEERTARHA